MTETIDIQNSNATSGRWTQQQHDLFIKGLQLYGRSWKKIQGMLKTRTGAQIRSHAQKFFLKFSKNGEQITNEQSVEMYQPEQKKNQVNMSFFLSQIVKEYSKGNNIDFWSAFICSEDNKKCQLSNRLVKTNSFIEYKKQDQETIDGLCPKKKIKH